MRSAEPRTEAPGTVPSEIPPASRGDAAFAEVITHATLVYSAQQIIVRLVPVILLTLHAYASWMPDRAEGYVHYQAGPQDQDERRARFYRANQAEPPAVFSRETQNRIIEILRDSQQKQEFELYAVATEAAHVHILIAWCDRRSPRQLRRCIKQSLSRCLKHDVASRTWFSRGGAVTSVGDVEHLTALACKYMPSHQGAFYVCDWLRGRVEWTGS